MPSIINTAVTAENAAEWQSLIPEAGSNRVHLVYIPVELNGGTTANDMPGSFNYNGQAYSLVTSIAAETSFLRGLALFAAKESEIATAEAGSGGVTAFKPDGTTSLPGAVGYSAMSVTLSGVDQSADLSALAATAGGFDTRVTGQELPHEVTFAGTTNDLALAAALTTQNDTVTWGNGFTEIVDDQVKSAWNQSLAALDLVADGNVTAGVSPDAGVSYNTVMIGLALPEVTAVNNDPTLDTPIADISVPANTSGTIADISGNFSDADGDTLTYSVAPALPTGMTLNTTTGVISGNGSITETAAANYTFSASDGQGGTDASDVVSIAVTTPAPVLTQALNVRLGSVMTIDTDASIDLTTYTTITATLGGVSCGASTRIAAGQLDFNVPGGLELGVNHPLIVTADGAQSNTLNVSIGAPTGKQVITLTSVDANSVLNDYVGDGPNNIGAGDQWVPDSVTDKGNTINITADGLFEIVNGAANAPHTFDWFYLDAQDNYAQSGTQTVTFSDNDDVAPVITLTGNSSVTHPHGISYIDQGATASDNFDGDITANIVLTGAVNVNAVGTYTLRYNVSDSAGNVATEVTRTVAVTDQRAPDITLNGPATLELAQNQSYTEYGATANDAVDGNLTQFISITGTVDTSTIGSYTRTYTVSDAAGNEATETRTINVVSDAGLPVISLVGASTITHPQGQPYTDAGATATDGVDGDLTGSIVTTGASFDVNVTGNKIIRYNVTDSAGNDAVEVQRLVIVTDQTAPIITLLGGSSSTIEQGDPWSEPGFAASDNNDGDITGNVVIGGDTVDINIPGIYVITYDVTDAAGNIATQKLRTITVRAPFAEGAITVTTPYGRTIVAFANEAEQRPLFTKDESDELDYLVDFGVMLQDDPISSVSVTSEKITVSRIAHEASQVQVWTAGGTVGITGMVTVRISSEAGRTIERSFSIRVGQY